MHPPRENRIEVLHEIDVVPVVAPQLAQIVAEFLAPSEELLVAGEAAAERVTPRVNDRGMGEHQMDETDMNEVAEHLVDEAPPAKGAVRLRTRQVARREGFDLLPVERGDRLRVRRPFGGIRARPQLERDGGDVRQL